MLLLSFLSLLTILLSLCGVSDVLIMLIPTLRLVEHTSRVFMIIGEGLFMLIVEVMIVGLVNSYELVGLLSCYY